MSLYLIVIGLANAAMVAVGLLCTEYAWWQVVASVVGATVGVIALDGLVAWLIRLLPERWFAAPRSLGAKRWEMRLYRALGIRRWKERVPELGCFTKFSKSRLERPTDADYLARYILECNYGVVIHLANALVGVAVLLLQPLRPLWLFAWPVTVINAILSLLPTFILRYNLPSVSYWHRRALRASQADRDSI